MATIYGLAMKISADATGVQKSLTPVERALQSLDQETQKVTEVFDKFAKSSSAAASIQGQFRSEMATLTDSLRAGDITAKQFADGFEDIRKEALSSADALKRADQVISDTRTDLEVFIETQTEYQQLLNDGLLPLENYTRAVQEAAEGLKGADLAAASEASGVNLDAVSATAEKAAENTSDLGDSLKILPGFLGSFVTSSTDFVNNATQIAERMSRLTDLMSDFARVVPLATRAFGFLFTTTGKIAGLIAVSGGVAAGLSRLEGEAQKLTNTANKLGVSFRFVETLQQAALVTGVSFETVNAATTRLLRSLANADDESNKAAKALSNLGINLDDLKENDTEGTIRAIASRLNAIEDPAKRATAAVAIFGKSGTELVPFLNGLREAEDTLDRFNSRLSSIDVARVLSLGESFNAVGAALRGVGNEALTPFIGAAQAIADGIAPVITEFGRSVGIVLDVLSPFTSALGGLVNVFGQLVGIGLKGINLFLDPLAMVFRGLSSVVEGVSKNITSFFKSISPVAERSQEIIRRTIRTSEELAKAFTEAIASGGKSIDDAIKKAAQFGQTGFQAALEFQRAVARLNVELADIGAVEYKRRLGEVTVEFEKQLDRAREIRSELNRALKVEQDRKDAASATADEILNQIQAQRQQAALPAALADSPERLTAFQRKLALEQEIYKVQEQASAARSANDLSAAKAADDRIVRLREAAEFEQQRVDGQKTSLDIDAERLKKETERRNRVAEILALRKREDDRTRDLLGLEASLNEQQARLRLEQDRADAEVQQLARTNAAATQADFLKILSNPNLTRASDAVRELTAARNELLEAQVAADAGFNEGFAKAFAESDKLIADAIEKTKNLGKAGRDAAQEFATAIKQAQARVDAGALTAPTFQPELDRLKKGFEEQLPRLEVLRQRELENIRLVTESAISANKRVDEFLKANQDSRLKAEFAAIEAKEKRERIAAENVIALQERIDVTERSLESARKQRDGESFKARDRELVLLKRALNEQKKIAEGRDTADDRQNQRLQSGFTQAQQFQSVIARQNETFLKSFTNTYAGANAALEASNAAAAEIIRQQEMSRPTNALAQTADVRTQQGQELVLQLAQNAQDPALIEAKLQTKQLQLIAQGISAAAANYFNTPVAIVGGAFG